jgi:flagellar protein FliO/FliZ
MVWPTLAGLLARPGQALAQTTAPAQPGIGTPNLLAAGIQMFGALALLIGVLLLAIYLMRRLAGANSRRYGGQELIRIAATKALAPKKYLALVEVGDTMLTLGITSEHITCLDKTNLQEFKNKFPSPPVSKQDGAFARRLKALTGVPRNEGETVSK